ncbi:Epimerase family protein [Fundidesulfovibrio magnetotacticus]|uniref:Epimerase family protein n=1 Tax=Fundidesulfovibrio magnetotacticus TaxID=2730080 RepID=A0A6V8LXN0_9BACT|nr:TIGR01777 family oxidoreductase [Fundidesulfovibrio magnetotacticus]GFK95008.1 Epimerase family protein [Fundidesulfovibrio magnetotacticus]
MNGNGRHVVVAGGGGFIGRALCRALLARGWRVTALTRGKPRAPGADPDGARPAFAAWDGRTADGWGHLADGAYALVNLAGESIADGRWTSRRKQAIVESRVFAGQAMVRAATQAAVRPAVLLQASAVGFYGDTGDDPVDESSPPGRGFLADVCLQWEASSRPVESLGVRRVVARTGLVLGRGGGVFEKMLPPFRYYMGGPLGHGRQAFPWIHLRDQVEAMVFLLEREDLSGPFNLCAPESAANRDFCQALGRALGRPCGLAAPAAALRLAFGEMAEELLLGGCRAFPKRLMESGYVFRHPRLAEALANLLAREAR